MPDPLSSIRYFEDALELALQVLEEERVKAKDIDDFYKHVKERLNDFLFLVKEKKFAGIKSILERFDE